MLTSETKRRIDSARDILVGQLPLPTDQVELITIALIYKFMDDIDQESRELGGKATFFVGEVKLNGRPVKLVDLNWRALVSNTLDAETRVKKFAQGIEALSIAKHIPDLFKSTFKNTFLKFRDGRILKLFLDEINGFTYDHSEELGNAFEYLLSAMGSQGENGQFRTPRHIIDFIVDVVDPQKDETILDPACGTGGFLISAYNHILEANTSPRIGDEKVRKGDLLNSTQKKKLTENITGYDITPLMTRLSRVNMYLHHFPNPIIHEYDTLTNDTRWDEKFNCILANPPFMTPKGGVSPHNKFRIPANRAEVLFSDYITEHLTPDGKAGFIVPEGIIFQSQNAYKQLRRMLVEEYLWAVVSLPAGVFQPYSGVKTSILLLDRAMARREKEVLFVKVENDGYDLGAQRRPIEPNDLPEALKVLRTWKEKRKLVEGKIAHAVARKTLLASNDISLSGERYRTAKFGDGVKIVSIGDLCQRMQYGVSASLNQNGEGYRTFRMNELISGRAVDNGSMKRVPLPAKEFAKYKLSKGDLLFNRTNSIEHVGRTGIFSLEGDYICASYLVRLEVKREAVLPEYLNLFMNSAEFQRRIKPLASRAVGQANISASVLAGFEIPLPPLEEQERLVAELEGYRQIIESARQILTHYKPTLRINPDWPKMKLGPCTTLVSSGSTPLGGKQNYSNKGILFVRSQNVLVGSCDFSDAVFITRETNEAMSRSKVQFGDVLLNITGASIGRCSVYRDDREANVNQHVCIIRLKPIIDPEYLCFIINQPSFQTYIMQMQSGASRQALNFQQIRNFDISVPPLAEQRRLVSELEAERALVEANRELAARFEQKLQSRLAEIWGEKSEQKPAASPKGHSPKPTVPA